MKDPTARLNQMLIRITAVKDQITAFGDGYAVYLVTFVDEDSECYTNKKLWCHSRVCCDRVMIVRQISEDDFQEL